MSRFISVKGEKGIYKRKIEQIKLTNPLKMLSPLSRYDLIFYSPDRWEDIPVNGYIAAIQHRKMVASFCYM